MKSQKKYVNGQPQAFGQFKVVKEILNELGIYRTLGGISPYFTTKLDRRHKHVETFVKGGYEFRIVETEVMSFSFDSLSVSEPYIQRECWFQPCID